MNISRVGQRRPIVAVVIATVAAAGLLPLATSTAAAAGEDAAGLGRHDRQLLAEARANGDRTVTLLIAADEGANPSLASDLEALGGQIQHRDDEVSYLRVQMPTKQADRASRLAGVTAADLDEVIPLDDPRPDGAAAATPYPAPGAATPRNNPYMPIGDTGAAAFLDAHPHWDGRNVTVGVLDTGITLDHPALATTTTGKPKIVDWVTYTDPFSDDDPTWVPASAAVQGPAFSVDGVDYTAPPSAEGYSFGIFNERDPRLGGEVGRDVNRDGNPAGSKGTFPVLWQGKSVWVDVDQDNDFTDEPAMREYSKNRDVRYFGTDNPATPVKEAMPFVVQVDTENDVANIGIVSGAHGTHVAGIIAANGLFGGAMSGAAPGAQLVSVRVCLFIAGCTAHALVEGMIYAAKRVDVINMSIGGLPSLNDGNNARAVLYDRLIEKKKVQMFISAGNSGPGENTVGDPSVASSVMSIGTHISDDTWQSNYGSSAPAPGTDNQHSFSSRGPREDGGFKPNVIAPGAAISSTPLWQAGGPVAGVHTLPPGYGMFNGTSMASPQAAGVGALLVSAAIQKKVKHDPERLRAALNSSSRFIDGYGAYEQGNGLIDANAAWAILSNKNLRPVAITSQVPVHTALSDFLATPGVGVGIHDREGVVLGDPYTRTYTLTRTSGGGGTYQLSFTGNDGTFSLGSSSITLDQGNPRTLEVAINPSTPGAHSAVLNFDDPSSPGIEYQTLNTVVVPYDLDEGDPQQVVSGEVARNQSKSYFFRVPENAPAFKVDFSGPSAAPGSGQARFLRFHPYGVGIDSNSSVNCYVPSVSGCSTGSATSRTASNPQAGVWEVSVEARRTSDADFTPFTLTASVLGATVSPSHDVIPSATVGTPIDRSLHPHQRLR